jgi:hypothetical protein
MNRRKVGLFFLLGFSLGLTRVWAQASFTLDRGTPSASPTAEAAENPTPTPNEAIQIPKPIVLKGSDRLSDSEAHSSPQAPPKGFDGTPWKAEADDHIPRGAAMAQMEESTFFSQIGDWNKSEIKPRTYYWHAFNGTDYCHYRDAAGNQWYGWAEGSSFRWALYHLGHFWWHDDYAQRSLYFDRGYWWWQGHRKDQFQVYLEDGHYHVCGSDGLLGEDLFTTGTEEVATQPVEKDPTPISTPGDDSGPPGGVGGGGSGFSH